MAGYEEALAALDGLWADGLADAERAEREARERYAAAEQRIGDLRAEIAEASDGIEAARARMAGLGDDIVAAQLQGDDGEVMAIQGEHARLSAMAEEATQRRRRAEHELGEICGRAGPDAHLAALRARRDGAIADARDAHEWAVKRQFEGLREALEDARSAAIGDRPRIDRITHEQSLAQGQRRESISPPARQADRAEERRRFAANRMRVDAAREREREAAKARQTETARKMGLPLNRLVL